MEEDILNYLPTVMFRGTLCKPYSSVSGLGVLGWRIQMSIYHPLTKAAVLQL